MPTALISALEEVARAGGWIFDINETKRNKTKQIENKEIVAVSVEQQHFDPSSTTLPWLPKHPKQGQRALSSAQHTAWDIRKIFSPCRI